MFDTLKVFLKYVSEKKETKSAYDKKRENYPAKDNRDVVSFSLISSMQNVW